MGAAEAKGVRKSYAPREYPYHLSAIASLIADIVVGLMACRWWRNYQKTCFLLLLIASVLFLVGSVHLYAVGLTELQMISWPLGYKASLIAYYLTSSLAIASQVVFTAAILCILKNFSEIQEIARTK